MSVGWMRKAAAAVLFTSASGCATAGTESDYAGRTVVDAVAQLGAPHRFVDDETGARYFTCGTSDVLVIGVDEDDPDSWRRPPGQPRAQTADAADSADAVETAVQDMVPFQIESSGFKPGPCTFTIVARWDVARSNWVATRTIRKGAGHRGHCGMRASG